jgi:CRISPR-associated endonuclease/helicase Cas3
MCPQHRTSVLDEVRRRLKNGAPCRLVATQLVEAGVDLDFPVVFRALGGLDSLAQAAGRCNREGLLDRGALEIFVAETAPPPGELRQALDAARVIARNHGGKPDLFGDPSLFTEYFRQFYGSPTDPKAIQTDRALLRFKTVGENFRMIDEGDDAVVIDLDDDCRRIVKQLRNGLGVRRLLRRRLQRYSVAVRSAQMTEMQRIGAVVETEEGSGIWVLSEIFASMYHQRFGLLKPNGFTPDPERLIK